MKKAVFAGTFDPFTVGHKKILESALALFDFVYVAVAEKSKSGVASDCRKTIVSKSIADLKNVEVDVFNGFLTDYIKKTGAGILVRGIRNTVDFEYEKSLQSVYKSMMPGLEICYIVSDGEINCVSSTHVREILLLNGDASSYICNEAYAEIIKSYGAVE